MESLSPFLAGGVVVGFLAASWSKIKEFGTLLMGRLVVRANLEDQAAAAVIGYCQRRLKQTRYGGRRRFGSFSAFVRPPARYLDVAYETVGPEPVVFWQGWRPLVLKYEIPEPNAAVLNGFPVVVSFLRGMFDLDTLVVDAMNELMNIRHKGDQQGVGRRYCVFRITGNRNLFRPGASLNGSSGASPAGEPTAKDSPTGTTFADRRIIGWERQDIGAPLPPGDPFAALALTDELRQIIEDGRRWLRSEAWYKARRIPWRMGWLFYGQPGTGKTSLARAVGQDLDLPIFAFDLSTFTNVDLIREWERVLSNAPCIAMFEDIDNVFEGRTNVVAPDGDGVTFDCYLNCLSGIGEASGVLVVITTNRVEMLDSALGVPDPKREGQSTRPGRIDRAVELPALTAAGRQSIAERILLDCPEKVAGVVAEGAGDSGAQFENRCSRLALGHYWGPDRPPAVGWMSPDPDEPPDGPLN